MIYATRIRSDSDHRPNIGRSATQSIPDRQHRFTLWRGFESQASVFVSSFQSIARQRPICGKRWCNCGGKARTAWHCQRTCADMPAPRSQRSAPPRSDSDW